MLAVLAKITAESLLSLYPVFVKSIGVALPLQMWSRFVSYIAVSALFIDYTYVARTIFSSTGLLLGLITLAHIYTSYKGFQLLDSGPAYTLFYIYPVLILLLAGYKIPALVALAAFGCWMLTLHVTSYLGILMILLAALTEALIYFVVRRLQTKNSWNPLFISYIGGAVLFSLLFWKDIASITPTSALAVSLGLNSLIGLGGYVLRFYAMTRLNTFMYALLSNVGIIMSYVYGYIWNGETVTVAEIVGTICIAVACLFSK